MLLRALTLLGLFLPLVAARAQNVQHHEQYLHYLYPAGAQQGQTLEVELGGAYGMLGANQAVIDGAPGITVKEIKQLRQGPIYALKATFVIAADAPVGRRLIRIAGGQCGLTNARPFFVGRLAEVMEKEDNNAPENAQLVTTPCVVNARVDPATDVDCFAFQGKSGQRVVAGILAQGMDTLLRGGRLFGFLDTNLELLDDKGRTLASAEDSLGLDPILEYTLKADGRYVLRVQSLFYKGSQSAIYRLTIGDVPYPTCVYPPGGKRGTKVEVTLNGTNVAPGVKQTVQVPAEGEPFIGVPFDHPLTDGRELPFVAGDLPETLAAPAQERVKAAALTLPVTVNARLEKAGEEHWQKVSLKKGQGILLEVTSQRHLRSVLDTRLRIFDAAGKVVAENDDGALFAAPNQCAHDFSSADSWLPFTAPADGEYYLVINDQGGNAGPLAYYRLSVTELKPDFLISQWPDAVPVWGAGTTASFVIHVLQWGGLKSDVQIRIEGLPAGWTGSVVNVPISHLGVFVVPYGTQALMTITAPKDAPLGAVAPFRVVGRVEQDGQVIERTARTLTLYGSSHNDRMHLRYSPGARAVVAAPLDSWLETSVKELTIRMGETIEIPVRIHRQPTAKGDLGVCLDGPINGGAARCSWTTPLTVKPDQTEIKVPFKMSPEGRPGVYGIIISRSWAADLRAGRPGPCTPIIKLTVLPAK